MDSGKEQNYWPGFVDALSNVVLTLIFVLVIFVFALVMASNKVEERMQQVTAMEQPSKEKIEDLQQELASVKAELSKVKSQNPNDQTSAEKDNADQEFVANNSVQDTLINVEEKAKAVRAGAISISNQEKNKVAIVFPSSVTEMDEKAEGEINASLDKVQPLYQGKKVLVRSILGQESYSTAKRLAYYRALTARNFLIEKRNIETSLISMTLVNADGQQNGRVEIVFLEN